ncbi:SIR2 family protein [Paraburkholderia aspalathi]|uniref:SIR2-like domain-containing protein n=1 Tax=Paraburkholderia aspalathi TaxID=1324617 RepID=A0A1I7CDX2_9BURK|nr:SIR2 family protein [Paraburkholderia aspalathi]SFT97611.1 SIR2-like domain-containing protein [Paraburkholderia aspalathi]
MTISEVLATQLRAHNAGPFLFAGSGLSRRYLGLEDWAGLLRRFCRHIKPYEYYLSSANGDLPTVAATMAEEFHEVWWTQEDYAASREKHSKNIYDRTGPLRVEICDYLKSVGLADLSQSKYGDEIAALSRLNVDGIITTNWDTFLQSLFPDYRVYVGQDELLFSNPQSIGEIYKIHGCVNTPRSLVLTSHDYQDFNERNAYLAAKLITIFVEHPVIFMGYSLNDPNIISLLRAICACIGQDKLQQLNNNLIFVQRARDGEDDSISQTIIALERVQIPITLVKASSFVGIYEAIESTKRKIPARVLRYCKEQLYELVKTTEPHGKLVVVDVDQVNGRQDIEFVVGVGVAAEREEEERRRLGDVGYRGITPLDLFDDLVFKDKGYEAGRVLQEAMPRLSKGLTYLPVFFLLRAAGINSTAEYAASGFDVDKYVQLTPAAFKPKSLAKGFMRNYRDLTVSEMIQRCTPEIVAQYLPFTEWTRDDYEVIHEFLAAHADRFRNSNYSTAFRKLACLYDRANYGWE